jgi:hypothetical protein
MAAVHSLFSALCLPLNRGYPSEPRSENLPAAAVILVFARLLFLLQALGTSIFAFSFLFSAFGFRSSIPPVFLQKICENPDIRPCTSMRKIFSKLFQAIPTLFHAAAENHSLFQISNSPSRVSRISRAKCLI